MLVLSQIFALTIAMESFGVTSSVIVVPLNFLTKICMRGRAAGVDGVFDAGVKVGTIKVEGTRGAVKGTGAGTIKVPPVCATRGAVKVSGGTIKVPVGACTTRGAISGGTIKVPAEAYTTRGAISSGTIKVPVGACTTRGAISGGTIKVEFSEDGDEAGVESGADAETEGAVDAGVEGAIDVGVECDDIVDIDDARGRVDGVQVEGGGVGMCDLCTLSDSSTRFAP